MYGPFINRHGGSGDTHVRVIPTQQDPGAPQPVHPEDVKMAAMVAAELDRHYPGYSWMVTADHRSGLVTFKSIKIKINLGMNLYLHRLHQNWDMSRVKRFGGEYLERFGLPRGRAPDYIDQNKLPESMKR